MYLKLAIYKKLKTLIVFISLMIITLLKLKDITKQTL